MFVDMVGFTNVTSVASRSHLARLLDVFVNIVTSSTGSLNGTIVKSLGDGYVISFESSTNAVLCGAMIQEALANHNVSSKINDRLMVRIAVNSGEVSVKNGDVYGETVNIASRVESAAEPGEVYFTESVYLAMNKNEVPSEIVNARLLKGIPGEVKVYKAIKDEKEAEKQKIIRKEGVMATALLPKDKVNILRGPIGKFEYVGYILAFSLFVSGVLSVGLIASKSENPSIAPMQVLGTNNYGMSVAPLVRWIVQPTSAPQPTPITSEVLVESSEEAGIEANSTTEGNVTKVEETDNNKEEESLDKKGKGKFLGVLKKILDK